MKHNEKRRSVLKNIGMGMAGLLGIASVKAAPSKSKKEVVGKIVEDQKKRTTVTNWIEKEGKEQIKKSIEKED